MNDSGGNTPSFLDTLWETDPAAIGGLKGRGMRLLQFLTFTVSNFFRHNGLLRATALSFTTLLSLVPLLALAFSVLKGFGAQNRLAPLIISQMAAGSEVVVTKVITYIGNTNMSSVGAIGLAALLYTSINMLGNIEDAFNVAWGVTQTRSLYRKFSDYVSVLVSAPLLMLAATSVTTTLQSKRVISWIMETTYLGDLFLFLLGLTPYVSVWIALFLLYMFIPNTRVSYKSALVGAFAAGTLWVLAQRAYIHFQVGAGNYNAIYGTLAALPILMIWIYTSWIIVLFGMELVAAHQSLKTFRRDLRGGDISESLRELLALATLRHIAEAFHNGMPGWEAEQLAVRLRIPLSIMHDTLGRLVDAGFIVHAVGTGRGYYPASEMDRIPLDRVLLALKRRGPSCKVEGEEEAAAILATVERAISSALEGITLRELAAKKLPRKEPPPTDKISPLKEPADVDKEGPVDI
jgi:membrane protein